MKNSKILLVVVVMLVGCGKKEKIELAKNYYQLGMLELENAHSLPESYHQALIYIDRALAVQPMAEYYATKAMILYNLGHAQESTAFFKKALAYSPTGKLRAEITNNFACVLAHLKHDNQALALWQQLIADEHYVTPEVAWFNQSKVFVSRKEFDRAQQCLHKAIEIAPQYVDARYYLAILAFSKHENEQAVLQLDTILALAPEHAGARSLREIVSARPEETT